MHGAPHRDHFQTHFQAHFRIWAPPESRVRIEYSTEVMRRLYFESARRDIAGILLGTQGGNTIRIEEAEIQGSFNYESAVRPEGLDLVGIFSARKAGEIFLTESDLIHLEQSSFAQTLPRVQPAESTAAEPPESTEAEHPASAEHPESTVAEAVNVALVVAGRKGGFFVSDHDGSIQAARSYEEFSLRDSVREPAPGLCGMRVHLRWSWVLWTGLAVMAMPLVLTSVLGAVFGTMPSALASSIPPARLAGVRSTVPAGLPEIFTARRPWLHSEAPLNLTVTGDTRTLRIAWNPFATADGARLEIVDGARRTAIAVSLDLASVTYEPAGNDVEVRLTATNASRSEGAHFVGYSAALQAPPPGLDLAHSRIANLELEATRLRSAIEGRRASVASLQEKVRQLIQPGDQ